MKEKKTSILIVDDEHGMRKLLKKTLTEANFRVEEAMSGEEAIRMVSSSIKTDLMLLDLRLPDKDGIDVIRAVREWSKIPIIVLSGIENEKEIVAVLEAGADDYVNKPFNRDILVARINVQLRTSIKNEGSEVELTNGRIAMNLLTHKVYIDGEQVLFTPKEYELLRYFLKNVNKILLHNDILKNVWGSAHGNDLHYLRVYVSQLREKIEVDPEAPKYIITEPGIGYRMESVNDLPTIPLLKWQNPSEEQINPLEQNVAG